MTGASSAATKRYKYEEGQDTSICKESRAMKKTRNTSSGKEKKPPTDWKALSQLGVAAKAAKRAERASWLEWPLADEAGQPRDIRSHADGERVVSWCAQQVALGRMSAGDGKIINLAVGTWARLHAGGDLAKQVKDLAALVARLQRNAKQPARDHDDRGSAETARRVAAFNAKQQREPAPDAALDRILNRKV